MDIHRLPPPSPRAPPSASGSNRTPSRPGTSSQPSSSGLLSGLIHFGRASSKRSPASEARSAIRKGDLAKLRELLEDSPGVALELDSHHDNLLGVAARGGHAQAAQLLLDYVACVPGGEATLANHRNDKGDTALHLAVVNGSAPTTGVLLGHPAIHPNAVNTKGDTPLHLAIGTGKLEAARELLDAPDIDVSVTDDHHGNCVLHRMATDAVPKPEWITLLASHPQLANRPNRRGETPLELAIANDRHTAVQALLEGADIDTEHLDGRLRTPLHQAVARFALTPAGHHVERRIKTLSLLANAPSVDPNATFANGHTMLTQLCAMTSMDRRAREVCHYLAHQAFAGLLGADGGRLDLNQPNAGGGTPLQLAAEAGNRKLVLELLGDRRTDPNMLTHWTSQHGTEAYRLLSVAPGRAISPAGLADFVEAKVTEWADKADPEGRHFPSAHISNALLGERMGELEQAGLRPSRDCSKGAVFRLALALEQCLGIQDYHSLADRARQLLKFAAADAGQFNLLGVEISREEVQSWAEGKLPDGGVNRLIDALVTQDRLASVHNAGLTARGSQIMQAIRQRLGGEALTDEQSIDGVHDAIDAAPDATAEWRDKARQGLTLALAHLDRVGEGLNVTVREALSLMWSHIQSYSKPASPEEDPHEKAERETLRDNLTHALLEQMVDMSDGYCDTGCVQRILYAGDGIDLSLLPGEPSSEEVHDAVAAIAGTVNDRFEALYGPAMEHLSAAADAPATSTAAADRTIARYADGRPLDNDLVVELKQELLEATATAELVDRRGWPTTIVRPDLDRMKAFMKDV